MRPVFVNCAGGCFGESFAILRFVDDAAAFETFIFADEFDFDSAKLVDAVAVFGKAVSVDTKFEFGTATPVVFCFA